MQADPQGRQSRQDEARHMPAQPIGGIQVIHGPEAAHQHEAGLGLPVPRFPFREYVHGSSHSFSRSTFEGSLAGPLVVGPANSRSVGFTWTVTRCTVQPLSTITAIATSHFIRAPTHSPV